MVSAMGRVDLEDGFHPLGDPPVRGKHFFELPVGAEFGRDKTGDAVGQAVRGAHFGDLVP